jgi:hypothetical protein
MSESDSLKRKPSSKKIVSGKFFVFSDKENKNACQQASDLLAERGADPAEIKIDGRVYSRYMKLITRIFILDLVAPADGKTDKRQGCNTPDFFRR